MVPENRNRSTKWKKSRLNRKLMRFQKENKWPNLMSPGTILKSQSLRSVTPSRPLCCTKSGALILTWWFQRRVEDLTLLSGALITFHTKFVTRQSTIKFLLIKWCQGRPTSRPWKKMSLCTLKFQSITRKSSAQDRLMLVSPQEPKAVSLKEWSHSSTQSRLRETLLDPTLPWCHRSISSHLKASTTSPVSESRRNPYQSATSFLASLPQQLMMMKLQSRRPNSSVLNITSHLNSLLVTRRPHMGSSATNQWKVWIAVQLRSKKSTSSDPIVCFYYLYLLTLVRYNKNGSSWWIRPLTGLHSHSRRP